LAMLLLLKIYLAFKYVGLDRTWWVFQRRVMRTIFDI
jgi:hypothetical protein